MWAAARFQLNLRPRSLKQLLLDPHFWLKFLPTIGINFSFWHWISHTYEDTIFDIMHFVCGYSVVIPSLNVLLSIQILHYFFKYDTDLTGMFISIFGSFTLIPIGAEFTATLIYLDIEMSFELIIQTFIMEASGVCLLIDTIMYTLPFMTHIEVVEANIRPSDELEEEGRQFIIRDDFEIYQDKIKWDEFEVQKETWKKEMKCKRNTDAEGLDKVGEEREKLKTASRAAKCRRAQDEKIRKRIRVKAGKGADVAKCGRVIKDRVKADGLEGAERLETIEEGAEKEVKGNEEVGQNEALDDGKKAPVVGETGGQDVGEQRSSEEGRQGEIEGKQDQMESRPDHVEIEEKNKQESLQVEQKGEDAKPSEDGKDAKPGEDDIAIDKRENDSGKVKEETKTEDKKQDGKDQEDEDWTEENNQERKEKEQEEITKLNKMLTEQMESEEKEKEAREKEEKEKIKKEEGERGDVLQSGQSRQ